MIPEVKQLMLRTKYQLVILADFYGVSSDGTRLTVAQRIAQAQKLKASKDWDAIASKEAK